MAIKSLGFCGIVVFLLIAIQTVYSCGPVALEKQAVDELVSVVSCFMFDIGSMQYCSSFLS